MVKLWRATAVRIWLVQALTPILCGFLLLFGVVGAGRAARVALWQCRTYSIAFTDIECTPPAGIPRQQFLAEVRAMSHQPAALPLLDAGLNARLRASFARHPLVETVQDVQVEGQQARLGLRVEIVYRRAVLAIRPSSDSVFSNGGSRIVDRRGVVLPDAAGNPRLPVLTTAVNSGARTVGYLWEDACVIASAATVAFLQPHLSPLHLDCCEVEYADGEIVLRAPGMRIVWGHAPGQETEGEASAEVKLKRLLEYQTGHDSLESLEHDVRLLAFQGHFPLSPARP